MNATEVAQTLAALVRDRNALPDEAATDLLRLVGHSLAAQSPASRRNARLGLLIDLVAVGSGEYVDTAAYDRERAKRAKLGEDWPDRRTLSRAYGHWLTAVRAAMRYWFVGSPARVASSHHHARPQAGYQPREIVQALAQLRLELGEDEKTSPWPTEWEYEEWVRLRRLGARRAGIEVRVPGLVQIRKAYGDFDRAVLAADRFWTRTRKSA